MNRVLAIAAVIGSTLLLIGSTSASAATSKRLQFDTCTNADSIGWARGTDSPSDGNHQSLASVVSSGGCAEAYSFRTTIEGKNVSDVRNLSFDYLASDSAGHGGAPRISVIMRDTNGTGDVHIAYLTGTPDKCGVPIVADPTWYRADFTGQTAPGCTFYTSDNESYTSDGVNSAWQNFAAAHPDYQVVLATDPIFGGGAGAGAFMVEDEAGNYHIDRLAIQNLMFIRNKPQYVQTCPTEASC
ncbi:MAG: hypothetical protein ACJ76P_08530 [Actinomycetota bacterium]